MHIAFTKYQGTGNDFILIDQRNEQFLNIGDGDKIEFLCNRRFGIGADGLILLEKSDKADFKMIYFNSDGRQSSMCGNGGRCIVHFAYKMGIHKKDYLFEAIDGLHEASFLSTKDHIIRLKMNDVPEIQKLKNGDFELNTGSPHYVRFVESIPKDVDKEGRFIRYSAPYTEQGINVNFVKIHNDTIEVATYERGVEAETLSCGTGVTAAAIAASEYNHSIKTPVNIQTKGGRLTVEFDLHESSYRNIWLTGPAIAVFEGVIEIS